MCNEGRRIQAHRRHCCGCRALVRSVSDPGTAETTAEVGMSLNSDQDPHSESESDSLKPQPPPIISSHQLDRHLSSLPLLVVAKALLPSSPGRVSSSERWDADKKTSRPSSSSSSSTNRPSSRASSCASRWGGGSRASSSSSSAKRWDAHKKPRPPASDELDDGASSTGSDDVELDYMPIRCRGGRYCTPDRASCPPRRSRARFPCHRR